MQVQFKRPATIHGVTYGKGVHEAPDSIANDWYFKAMQSDGDVIVHRLSVSPDAVIEPATLKADEVIMLDESDVAALDSAETQEEVDAIIEQKAGRKKKVK